MIETLSIRSLGVISSAQLELQPGFTAITGETGAGKTMLLTGLGLLLGERADSSVVRSGEKQLLVEGRIISADPHLQNKLAELGAEVSGGEILINRTVSTDGRSRAAIGGASVPVSTLNSVAQELVTVHGQSEQIRLKSIAKQRDALDEFGGEAIASSLASYSQTYTQFREHEQRLNRMRSSSEQDAFRIAKLKEQIADLERLEPKAGELSTLSEQLARLSNVEGLRLAASEAHELLAGEELDARSQIGRAKRVLESSSDSKLREIADLAAEATGLINEIALQLSSYLTDLEADPQTLDQLQRRKSELVALERKYGSTIDELVEHLPVLQSQLLDLDNSDEQIEKLEIQLAALESQLSFAAKDLTDQRKKTAKELSKRVSEELGHLAMGDAQLQISITELTDFEASGSDRVEFLLANRSGSEPRPLAKGASGGELSRIMLAIELVLAGKSPLPTMIFDEVDAGVGGGAAIELGRRLRELARSTQVIVVTHLPQVAAFADHQIRIFKDSSGGVSASSVSVLSQAEREQELARMLSGNAESEIALSHAKELLELRG
ncbi:MAG: repair protein RecN [Actinomycetota bacterium]